MKLDLELTLTDVFGGDGFTRFIDVEEPKLIRTRTTKRTRSDIGVGVESGMDEVVTEKVKKDVHTFRSENGTPVLRLGGVHGKLWGALKEARGILYAMGDSTYRSRAVLQAIQVLPLWIPLETDKEMEVQSLPQVLNTMGRTSMIIQRYDVIPECTVRVTLVFPDALRRVVDGLLEQLPNMGILNKRRAIVKDIKVLSDGQASAS
ncbi:MAG: hypothetical protein ABIH46_12160 [Chloroflexota bacterium]